MSTKTYFIIFLSCISGVIALIITSDGQPILVAGNGWKNLVSYALILVGCTAFGLGVLAKPSVKPPVKPDPK